MKNDEHLSEVLTYVQILMGYDFINRLEHLLKKNLLFTGKLSSLYGLINHNIYMEGYKLESGNQLYYNILEYVVGKKDNPIDAFAMEIKGIYIDVIDIIEKIYELGLINDAKIIALELIEEIPYMYTGSLYTAIDILSVLSEIVNHSKIERKCKSLLSVYDLRHCFPRNRCDYISIHDVELSDITHILKILLDTFSESQQRMKFIEEVRKNEYKRLVELAKVIYQSENIGIVFELKDMITLLELETLPQIILYNDRDKDVSEFIQEILGHSSVTFVPIFSLETPSSLYFVWLRETTYKQKPILLNINDTPLALIIKSIESIFKYITIDIVPTIRIIGRNIYLQHNNNRIELMDLKENLLKHYGPINKLDESIKKSIGFYILSVLNT